MQSPNRRIIDLRGMEPDESIKVLVDIGKGELDEIAKAIGLRKKASVLVHMMALASVMEAVGDMIGLE